MPPASRIAPFRSLMEAKGGRVQFHAASFHGAPSSLICVHSKLWSVLFSILNPSLYPSIEINIVHVFDFSPSFAKITHALSPTLLAWGNLGRSWVDMQELCTLAKETPALNPQCCFLPHSLMVQWALLLPPELKSPGDSLFRLSCRFRQDQ